MLDVLLDLPWKEIGEAAVAVGVTVAVAAGLYYSAKCLWEYLTVNQPALVNKVRVWFDRQRKTSKIYKGAVFIIKSIKSGGRKIVGLAVDEHGNRKEITGATVIVEPGAVPEKMPTEKEFAYALAELGIEA